MSKKKVTILSESLIVKKGLASPSIIQEHQSNDKTNFEPLIKRKNLVNSGTISVTVRLDPLRYEKLKLFGVNNRMTNQDIIVLSLDKFIK